ncbi:pentatricopeptide repeat-containing protein, partial [Tanacetum coccineum]
MACHSLSMAMTLNVMFIFTLVYVGDCRPFAVHAPTPGPESATTNMEYLKAADDTVDYSLSPQDLSFDLPFPENPFQTPIPDFSLPPIFGFPFPNLPPFGIPDIPFLAPPPMVEYGKCVHVDVVKYGLNSDRFVGTALVGFYAACGGMVDARKVFEEVTERDIVAYTSLISGYAK